MNYQTTRPRKDEEWPACIEQWGWKYHHLGVPTREKKPGERYISAYKFYVSGFDTSPFGIEWMRFEPGSPFNNLIQTVPHLAFVVPDLDYEVKQRGFTVLVPPNRVSEELRVAMIEHDGAPVELMEFSDETK